MLDTTDILCIDSLDTQLFLMYLIVELDSPPHPQSSYDFALICKCSESSGCRECMLYDNNPNRSKVIC